MPLLECVGLVKDFPDKRAIDNVAFRVEQGEIVALVGPEGAGKTTAYRLVCGLLSPTSGRVRLAGVDVTDWMPDRRQRLGIRFIARDASVYRTMTVEHALLADSQPLEMNPKQQRSQADELLRQFGLNAKRSELVGSLSFGEWTRLAIAKCLVGKPSLLVLDEPFEATDLVTTHGIESILKDAFQSGVSVLLTDKRGRKILTLAHRTYVLGSCKVIASGDAKTVLGNPNARRAYFGDDGFPKTVLGDAAWIIRLDLGETQVGSTTSQRAGVREYSLGSRIDGNKKAPPIFGRALIESMQDGLIH